MNETLKKRIFPNQSIKLRPPSPNAPHEHLCDCQMCNLYEPLKQRKLLEIQQQSFKGKLQAKLKSPQISSKLNCDSKSLEWLLSRLMLPQHKIFIRGVDVFIPETMFFKDGEAVSIYMNREIHDCRVKKVKKQKISNTYVQKLFNERRRKYRDQVAIKTGDKKVEKKQSMFAKKEQKIDTKDAAVIQYIDGSEQLITENQLINLMLKRKQDLIWKSIVMLKNFISSKESALRHIKIDFQYESHLYPDLFERAKKLMRVYGGNIQHYEQEYISDSAESAFCEDLLNQNLKVYAEYVLYKVIQFIEYFYDEKVEQMECAMLVNEFGRVYILDVFTLQKKDLVKYTWTKETYQARADEEENKIFMNDRELDLNPENEERSKCIEEKMMEKYETEKFRYGLSVEPDHTTEEKANDKFFAFLHPEFKLDLSSVLKTEKTSIMEFKKRHLGYTPEKKPIAGRFNSHFVRTLHDMTPRLKLSKDLNKQEGELPSSRQTKGFRSRMTSTSFVSKREKKPKSTLEFY